MDEPRLGPSLGPNEHQNPTGVKRVGWEPLPPRPTKSILKREIDKIHEMRERMDGRLEELKQYIWEEAHAPTPEEQKQIDPESVHMSVQPPSIAGVNIDYERIIRGVKEAIERDRARQERDEQEEDADELYEAVECAAREMLDKADAARAEANAMLNRVAGARGKAIEPAARQLLGQTPNNGFTEEATNHKECVIRCGPIQRCCGYINPRNWTPSKWSRKRWVTIMSVVMILVAVAGAGIMYWWACNYGGLDRCIEGETMGGNAVDYTSGGTTAEYLTSTTTKALTKANPVSVTFVDNPFAVDTCVWPGNSQTTYHVGKRCCLNTNGTEDWAGSRFTERGPFVAVTFRPLHTGKNVDMTNPNAVGTTVEDHQQECLPF